MRRSKYKRLVVDRSHSGFFDSGPNGSIFRNAHLSRIVNSTTISERETLNLDMDMQMRTDNVSLLLPFETRSVPLTSMRDWPGAAIYIPLFRSIDEL